MNSGQIDAFLRRSRTTSHLLQLLSLLLKTALCRDSYLASRFIHYACSISLPLATSAFDHLSHTPSRFAWNSIIRSHARSSSPLRAVELFSRMRRTGLEPDKFTYPFVIKACGKSGRIGEGRGVHSLALKVGLGSDSYVGNTLIRMYAACGNFGYARQVFDEMRTRDIVSWSSMIAGYVACGFPLDAFETFRRMRLANEKPNAVTFVSLLSACSHLVNIRAGESIHSYIIQNCLYLDAALGTALLEMYSKCGHIEKSLQIFWSMDDKNLQSWTLMVSCLADHGRGEDVIFLFDQMEPAGLKPDSILFSGILSACGHLGLVDEGRRYFQMMEEVYGVRPTTEHYGCMVDLLGRAGLIEEAHRIIEMMPMEPNSIILRSFIGACRNHGHLVKLGDDLMKLLIKLEPDVGSNYVLAANMSSLSSSWTDAAELWLVMKRRGLKKAQGSSWVEVDASSVEGIKEEAAG
ncbi:uncharacterized protein J3R85_015915 [Psidium guajava]|nr:uncharacterized protein J3R85_015915 [Psidium guajava]